MDAFPSHNWHAWKFERSPKGWWEKLGQNFLTHSPQAVETMRAYIIELEHQFGIRQPEDWIRITAAQLGATTAARLKPAGGLTAVLRRLYPNVRWETLERVNKSTLFQLELTEHIEGLLPTTSR